LSLRLLIDEDTQAKPLVKLIKNAGHDVVTVNDVNLIGSSDETVLNCAIALLRVLITHNCNDFKLLHQSRINHPGILAIYRDRNKSKNLTHKDIVRSIANIEAAQIKIDNQFIALNQWNY